VHQQHCSGLVNRDTYFGQVLAIQSAKHFQVAFFHFVLHLQEVRHRVIMHRQLPQRITVMHRALSRHDVIDQTHASTDGHSRERTSNKKVRTGEWWKCRVVTILGFSERLSPGVVSKTKHKARDG
jgi:hypothetical protein